MPGRTITRRRIHEVDVQMKGSYGMSLREKQHISYLKMGFGRLHAKNKDI